MKRRFSWGKAGMVAICMLAVVFSALSIYSSNRIAEQASQIYLHPYAVKSETQVMRSRLYEMQSHLPALLTADHDESVDLTELLSQRDRSLDQSLENIRERFLGPGEYVDELETAVNDLRHARLDVLHQVRDDDALLSILDEVVKREVDPYTQDVDLALARISDHADMRVKQFSDTAEGTRKVATTGALVLCALIVAMVVITSISNDRKNREIEYRDKLFDLLSSSIDDVFLIYDYSLKRMEYVSENSMRILGIAQESFRKKTLVLRDYMPEESVRVFDEFLGDGVFLENSYASFEFNGKRRQRLAVAAFPVYSNGSPHKCIIVISDQTEMLERQNALSDALLSAQRANNAKREFLARMSHEIRTPMNTIIGMTALSIRHIDDIDYVKNCLAHVTNASGHLLSLINDILDMSKIEDEKLTINKEPFELKNLVDSISSIVYPQTVQRKLHFEIEITGPVEERLIGDALRTQQILINLLSNAVKFTPENGQVRLSIQALVPKHNRQMVRFAVTDTGIGMSEEFLKRLYTPFEQADSSIAQKYGGSGLGMSITHNLVTLMGGAIAVQSELEQGSCFTVELPFDLPEERKTGKTDAIRDVSVLVVDDDKGICEYAMLLMEQIGVNASWVTSGREAVTRVIAAHEAGDDYDVCFIDWCMPEMDGVETARRIRQHLGPEALIIIISSYDWSTIENEARDAGVNAFIAKPFFASSIFDALNSVLNQGGVKESEEGGERKNFSGHKVLLAEDNEINQEIAVTLLHDVGVEVDWAPNGQRAHEMFKQSSESEYSLILMDIQMPVMDGYEATRVIRRSGHPNASAVPILAMTANAFNEDVAAARDAGMNGHLSKPIDVNLLYTTLGAYLAPARGARETTAP